MVWIFVYRVENFYKDSAVQITNENSQLVNAAVLHIGLWPFQQKFSVETFTMFLQEVSLN
jgi:hypothetical protein